MQQRYPVQRSFGQPSLMRLLLIGASLFVVIAAIFLRTHSARAASSFHTRASVPAALELYHEFDAYIQASTGLYVADEESYTGSNQYMLRARTSGSALGTWEQFHFFTGNDNYWYIQASTGLFVADERSDGDIYKYMLRARTSRSALGPWEQFNVVPTLTGKDWIQASNYLFVADEESYTGNNKYMLRARTGSNLGTWEEFRLHCYNIDDPSMANNLCQ